MTLFFEDSVAEVPALFVDWQTVVADIPVVVFDVPAVFAALAAERESSNFPVLSATPGGPVLVFFFPPLPTASFSALPETFLADADALVTAIVFDVPAPFSAVQEIADVSALEVVFVVLVEPVSFVLQAAVGAVLPIVPEAVFESVSVLLQLAVFLFLHFLLVI